MNDRKNCEFSLFAKELRRYMSPAALNQIAMKTGSMRRKRKCQGHHFLSLWVWLNQKAATTSLTQLCSEFQVQSHRYENLVRV